MFCEESLGKITGSPSSKYEHRRTSALLRNIRNIRICMGKKKPIVSVTYENERISIKNSLSYLKCVLRLSCVVQGPIYGRFMGFCVNVFLSIQRFLFLLKSFHFRRIQKRWVFFPIQILLFRMLRNNADVCRCSYFELGLPVERLMRLRAFPDWVRPRILSS